MTRNSRENRFGLGALGTRLLLAFAVVAVSSVLVLTGAALVGVDRGVQAGEQADRQQVADSAGAAAADAYQAAGGWEGADLTRAVSIGEAASARLVILDAAGSTVAASGTAGGHSGGNGGGMGSGASVAEIVIDGAQVGSVRVSQSPMATSRVLDIAWAWILISAIVALAIAFTASWVVTRFLVGPLQRMTDAARSFTAGNRASRVTGRAPGELGELATAFNGMADEVVRSDRDRRNLTADVAHELRTPLAALQAGLEELRDGFVPPDAERLAALHDQSLRLGRVVADLAELSAVETAGPLLQEGLVDLATVAREEVALHESQLRASGLHVSADLAEPVLVRADADRLHQAVGNVLANAARYCRPGDEVSLSLSVRDHEAALEIADTGPGIATEDLPFVFDRLWRGESAREIPGSGIGLAVVREIVSRHGGSAEVESPPGEGTRVTIRLPVAIGE
ncbi:HAMP domain-containing sensor histidine kinase [Salinibacterium sp. TMP30]|uniref:sensor histidine kinase n=1 Tax=Salinibacterium sp. TMP30 TaxID=3138237 RepID=UPI003139DBA6